MNIREKTAKFATVCRLLFILLTVLAPLKYGTVITVGNDNHIPGGNLLNWLYMDEVGSVWPVSLFALLAGVLLLLVVITYPQREKFSRFGLIPIAWTGLFVFSFIGFIKTTELHRAMVYQMMLGGVVCYVWSAFKLFRHDKACKRYFIIAITTVTILISLNGVYQRHYSYDKKIETLRQQEKEFGLEVMPEIYDRLEQKRINGTFIYSNSLAGYLILISPLAIFALFSGAKHYEPVKVSRPLFTITGSLLFLLCFYYTGSRAAIVALGGAIGLGIVLLPKLKKYRYPILIFAAIAGVAVFIYANNGRTFSSFEARKIYYAQAVKMFKSSPVVGVGQGEFLPYFLKLKPGDAECTQLPHCMLLGFMAQGGILLFLVGVITLIIPIFIYLFPKDEKLESATLSILILCGFYGWAAHAQADFHLYIPGGLAIAAILPLLMKKYDDEQNDEQMEIMKKPLIGVGIIMTLFILFCSYQLFSEVQYYKLTKQYNHPISQRPPSVLYMKNQTAKFAKLLPLSYTPWQKLANFAISHGDFDTAIYAFQQAIPKAPHRSSFYAGLAQCYLRQGKKDLANSALQKALEWYPNSPQLFDLQKRINKLD